MEPQPPNDPARAPGPQPPAADPGAEAWTVGATTADEADLDLDLDLEQDDAPPPTRPTSAPNRLLLGALLMVLAFGAGAWMQRTNDEGMIRPSADPIDKLAASVPAEGPTGPAGSRATAAKEPAEHAHPAAGLEGVLVSVDGTELVVREASGAQRKAVVGDQTSITTTFGIGRLQPGSTVAVTGPVGADGRVVASAVTQRTPSDQHAEPGHADTGHADTGHADTGHADAGHADAGHADAGH